MHWLASYTVCRAVGQLRICLETTTLQLVQETMLNEQLDQLNASRTCIAALSERLKDLEWDSPGEQCLGSSTFWNPAAAGTVSSVHADGLCRRRILCISCKTHVQQSHC
jgi:hypothetical protein